MTFWDELYFIELSPGSKIPKRAWGGLDQDLGAAEHVLTADGLEADRRYAYVAHREHDLGIIDLDLYKDDAPPLGDFSTGREPLLVESPSGGLHVPFLAPSGALARTKTESREEDGPRAMLTVADGLSDFVDLKGELGGGYCVLPFGTDYEITGGSADRPPLVADPTNPDELFDLANVGGETILEPYELYRPTGEQREAPAPGSITGALGAKYEPGGRHEHPFHGSSSGDNFYVFPDDEFFYCYRHEAGGTLLHLHAMELGYYGCGDWKRMEDGLRAETHRTVREKVRERGDAHDDDDAQREWVACDSGLDEWLGPGGPDGETEFRVERVTPAFDDAGEVLERFDDRAEAVAAKREAEEGEADGAVDYEVTEALL